MIVLAAILTATVYPTHRNIMKTATNDAQREAMKRVVREAVVTEARRLGPVGAYAVDVDALEDDQPPAPPTPPTPPGPAEIDAPRIIVSAGAVTISAVNVQSVIDVALASAEMQVKEALAKAGVAPERASAEAKRAIAAAQRAAENPAELAAALSEDSTIDIVSSGGAQPRWNIRIWNIDIEGTEFSTPPTRIEREPLLTVSQQSSLEEAARFDVRKAALGAVSLLGAVLLSLLLLIVRGFAGRSAHQTQRVKAVEAAAKVDSSARQVAEAQLKAMQAQVEPHFLFNTLAHVKALQEIDVKQAGDMLDHLITYLRTALPNLREVSSTLGKEFDLAQAYLNILKLRMGDRLQFSLDLPESLKTQAFPPALVINLVENAIKHGVERARAGGSVRLTAQRVGELITVTVADTGRGLDVNGPAGTGVGLDSIRNRLRLMYGDAAKLVIEPNSPTGVIATIAAPVTLHTLADGTPASAALGSVARAASGESECNVQTALLLAVFGGIGSAHHWYLRRKKTAIAQCFFWFAFLMSAIEGDPIPFFGIIAITWLTADIIMIATKSIRDSAGLRVTRAR